MMEIKNLEHEDFETLFQCFEKSFSDYEIRFEKEEVRSMLKRRGYDSRLSFAAFDNGEMVAFVMNGIGTFNGISSAYDVGTGTIQQYRGRGIAGDIFAFSMPYLKEAGVRQYVLEVLQNNRKAISIYQRMGFEVTREFDCFRQTIAQVDWRKSNGGCQIMPVDMDSVRRAQDYCDICPSWQNGIDSIVRGGVNMTCLGAFIDGRMVGYCVIDANTGDLAQIAVQSEYRRRGIASRLLQEATVRMKTGFVKILNIASDHRAMRLFLESNNIPLASKQFEMILSLQ